MDFIKMLPKEAIQEFIELYWKEYGEILNMEEATQKANQLMWLFKEFKNNQSLSIVKK